VRSPVCDVVSRAASPSDPRSPDRSSQRLAPRLAYRIGWPRHPRASFRLDVGPDHSMVLLVFRLLRQLGQLARIPSDVKRNVSIAIPTGPWMKSSGRASDLGIARQPVLCSPAGPGRASLAARAAAGSGLVLLAVALVLASFSRSSGVPGASCSAFLRGLVLVPPVASLFFSSRSSKRSSVTNSTWRPRTARSCPSPLCPHFCRPGEACARVGSQLERGDVRALFAGIGVQGETSVLWLMAPLSPALRSGGTCRR